METTSTRSSSVADSAILLLVASCLSIALYHPYYFGDELYAFISGMQHKGAFGATLVELNAYKPRVLMNAIWAAVMALEAPRWIPMLLNAVAMAACAVLVYATGRRVLAATRAASLFAALLLLGSRFGVMFYYDYVSGTIETMALAFFLGGLFLSADALFRNAPIARTRSVAAISCFLLMVLVHERYVAGLVAMMAVACLFRWRQEGAARGPKGLAFPIASAVLPLLLVLVLVTALSSNSLTMGTNAKPVQLSGDTLYIAGTYLLNVFLGSNFGPVWFVGLLNQDAPSSTTLFLVSGVAFALAWLLPWVVRARSAIAVDEAGRPRWQAAAVLLAFVLGMVVVASLPGADRQEARWMFPVFAAILLLVLAMYRGLARYLLLALMLASQAWYLWFGTIDMIASIDASKAARQLGRAIDTVHFPARSGVIINAPEPISSWVLGSADGAPFCHANAPSNCVHTDAAVKDGQPLPFGFGLVPNGKNKRGEWSYRYVSRMQIQALQDPASLPDSGEYLGRDGNWPEWTFADPAQKTTAGLVLDGVTQNFHPIKADMLDGKILVYRAEAVAGAPVPMRIQVNWHDAAGNFLIASIKVVDVSGPSKDYSTLLTAPSGAGPAYVYATLHDDARGRVLLKSIRLIDPSMN